MQHPLKPVRYFSVALVIAVATLLITTTLLSTSLWAAGTEVLVRGRVVDKDGEPIRGARITMTRVGDPEWREVLETKRSGRFKIFLRDGANKFDVRVEKDGYQITESRFEPLVFASAEERQMGLGGTHGTSFEIDFTLRSVSEETQVISAQDAYNQGVKAARERRYEEAIAFFKQVLELEPEHPSARMALVKAHYDSRQAKEAAELLDEVLQAEDVAASTLELSYHVMRDAGRLEEAAKALDRLWAKAPQTAAEELFELATIWRSRGDKERARVAVERALEVRPKKADVHYFYARLLVVMAEPELALEHFRRFLELDADSMLAGGVEAKILELEAGLAKKENP